MPGLSLAYETPSPAWDPSRAEAALAGLLHRPPYVGRVLVSDNGLFLGATAYPQYPIQEFDGPDFYICLEGAVYSLAPEDLGRELAALAGVMARGGQTARSRLAEWLMGADGEFLIFIREKRTGRIHVINDLLGLLPCYHRQAQGRFHFSRDVRFVTGLADETAFDRLALAQYLVLGYNLGRITYFSDIQRYPPATWLSLDPATGQARLETLHQYNYEQEENAGQTAEQNVARLVELFDQACGGRVRHAGESRLLLSLSGGRDSRAVLSGLARGRARFQAVSFSHAWAKSSPRDVQVAQETAAAYGVEWRHVRLPAPTAGDLHQLLRLKSGFNGLEMGHVLVFLRTLEQMFPGPSVYVTGDTGLAPKGQFPGRPLRGMNDLLDDIIGQDGYFSPRAAARLLNLRARDIRDHLRAEMESYPERSLEGKFLHYRMHNRELRYHTEGMDRNRCFFPLMSPLVSPVFKHYLVGCPQEQKKGSRLYDLFLVALDQRNRGAGLHQGRVLEEAGKPSWKAWPKRVYDRLPLEARRLVKKHVLRTWQAYAPGSTANRIITGMFQACPALGGYFSWPEVQKTLRTCSKLQLHNLLSLTAAIEEYAAGTSTLERFQNEPLDEPLA